MKRRGFLSSAAVLALGGAGLDLRSARAAPLPADPIAAGTGWRRFEITTHVFLGDAPGAAQLWLPLAQTAAGYQIALDTRVRSNGRTGVARDAKYGAGLLKIDWNGDATAKAAKLVQTVATRDRNGGDPLVPVTEVDRRFWLQPSESLPTDGIVRATAERIVAGINEPRARLRAIYDWVLDNTYRDPKTPGCGIGDIKSMLETGNLGGKCADINSLMTGLARAAGFPARDVYGIRMAESRSMPDLGASGNVSKAQHCRSEVYLEGTGWFPVDPADVRKVMLERKLASDSAEIRSLRERLFGSWEMNWVGYNSATDIVLPGAMGHQRPNFAFLMYPCAFTTAGQPDCLDPARFEYTITSREVAVGNYTNGPKR